MAELAATRAALQIAERQRDRLEERSAAALERQSALRKEVAGLQNALQEAKHERVRLVQDAAGLTQLRQTVQALEEEKAMLQIALKAALEERNQQAEAVRLMQTVGLAQGQLTEIRLAEVEKQNIQALVVERESLHSALHAAKKNIDLLMNENREARDQLRKATSQVACLEVEFPRKNEPGQPDKDVFKLSPANSLPAEVRVCVAMIESLSEEMTVLRTTLVAAEQQRELLAKDAAESSEKLGLTLQCLAKLEGECATLEADILISAKRVASAEEDFAQMRQALTAVEREREVLEEKDAALTEKLSALQRGEVPEVQGSVIQLVLQSAKWELNQGVAEFVVAVEELQQLACEMENELSVIGHSAAAVTGSKNGYTGHEVQMAALAVDPETDRLPGHHAVQDRSLSEQPEEVAGHCGLILQADPHSTRDVLPYEINTEATQGRIKDNRFLYGLNQDSFPDERSQKDPAAAEAFVIEPNHNMISHCNSPKATWPHTVETIEKITQEQTAVIAPISGQSVTTKEELRVLQIALGKSELKRDRLEEKLAAASAKLSSLTSQVSWLQDALQAAKRKREQPILDDSARRVAELNKAVDRLEKDKAELQTALLAAEQQRDLMIVECATAADPLKQAADCARPSGYCTNLKSKSDSEDAAAEGVSFSGRPPPVLQKESQAVNQPLRKRCSITDLQADISIAMALIKSLCIDSAGLSTQDALSEEEHKQEQGGMIDTKFARDQTSQQLCRQDVDALDLGGEVVASSYTDVDAKKPAALSEEHSTGFLMGLHAAHTEIHKPAEF
jgi:hypothetical protein